MANDKKSNVKVEVSDVSEILEPGTSVLVISDYGKSEVGNDDRLETVFFKIAEAYVKKSVGRWPSVEIPGHPMEGRESWISKSWGSFVPAYELTIRQKSSKDKGSEIFLLSDFDSVIENFEDGDSSRLKLSMMKRQSTNRLTSENGFIFGWTVSVVALSNSEQWARAKDMLPLFETVLVVENGPKGSGLLRDAKTGKKYSVNLT